MKEDAELTLEMEEMKQATIERQKKKTFKRFLKDKEEEQLLTKEDDLLGTTADFGLPDDEEVTAFTTSFSE